MALAATGAIMRATFLVGQHLYPPVGSFDGHAAVGGAQVDAHYPVAREIV